MADSEFSYSTYAGGEEPDQQDTEQADPDSLAAQIRKHATEGDAKRPPLPQESQTLIDRMNQLAANYETAPENSKKSLAQAMDKADQLYKDQANRNEWLEVAQMLGRAGAQFAAGMAGQKAGGAGRDMTLNLNPGIDYGKRTEQAAADYRTRLGGLESLQRIGSEEQKNQYNREFAPLEYGVKSAENAAERKSRQDIEGGREAQATNRTEASERAANARTQEAERGANLRAQTAQQTEASRDERESRKEQNRDLMNQAKEENAQYKDQLAGIPGIASEIGEDASPKDIAAFRNKHAKELGSLSPQDIADAKQAATTPGKLWGTNFDADKFQEELSNKVRSTHSDRLSNIQDAINRLYKKGGPVQSTDQQTSAPATAPAKSVTSAQLTEYSKVHNMSEDAARKFLTSQGYSIQ